MILEAFRLKKYIIQMTQVILVNGWTDGSADHVCLHFQSYIDSRIAYVEYAITEVTSMY